MLEFILIFALVIVIASYIEQITVAVLVGGVCVIAAQYLTDNVSPEAWTFLKGIGAVGGCPPRDAGS
jgi:hypothetical protein